jgi:hypothetical protein
MKTLLLLTAVSVGLIAAGCSDDDRAEDAGPTTTTSTPSDADHVVPPCDFHEGDPVVEADFSKECISVFDCPDGRQLLVAGLGPEGAAGDLAGFRPDHGDPPASDVVWHLYEHELQTRQNNTEGRLELVGDCPTLE